MMAGIPSNNGIAPLLREENVLDTILPAEPIEHATMMRGVQFTDADFSFNLDDGIAPNLLEENAMPATFPTTLDQMCTFRPSRNLSTGVAVLLRL